uniref:ATP-grasp domain-containing protein n=1 Tax=Steinernema glaseri TaxID=37863 RepID=A0A1I8AN77_9BILA
LRQQAAERKYPMSVRLGIVMDPIAQISYKKDSSLAMLLAAQARGWSLFYMEQHDLYQSEGVARARMRPLKVFADPEHWFELEAETDAALSELDVILMRKDPPFDMDRRPDIIREFAAKHGDVILKPLDGMGGTSIFRHRVGDPNLSVILETLTALGTQQIMAQAYLPAIKDGDKRILMIDGEPVPYCLARIPASGETRGNLAAGGRGEARELTERDRWIAAQVGPTLREKGLLFVGLDVIGEHLTEINVTSPTCIREIDNAYGTQIGAQLMDAIDRKLKAR